MAGGVHTCHADEPVRCFVVQYHMYYLLYGCFVRETGVKYERKKKKKKGGVGGGGGVGQCETL